MSFNGKLTHPLTSRCTEASYPDVLVNLAERGKPDALSGAVQGVSPWSRPGASEGDGEAGTGRGRKRMPPGNRVDRGIRAAPRCKAADFSRV